MSDSIVTNLVAVKEYVNATIIGEEGKQRRLRLLLIDHIDVLLSVARTSEEDIMYIVKKQPNDDEEEDDMAIWGYKQIAQQSKLDILAQQGASMNERMATATEQLAHLNIMRSRTDNAATVQEPAPMPAKESNAEDKPIAEYTIGTDSFLLDILDEVVDIYPHMHLTMEQFATMMQQSEWIAHHFRDEKKVNAIAAMIKRYQLAYVRKMNDCL